MPVFVVVIKADSVEHITRIAPVEGRNTWQFKIKCDGCNEETPKFIDVDGETMVEVDGGACNACFKCKECKKDISINILSDSNVEKAIAGFTSPANPKTNKKWARVALDRNGLAITAVDFRGGEPVDMRLDDGFVAYAAKKEGDDDDDNDGEFIADGAQLEGVDLSDDFADYDEASEQAVTISGAKAVFVKDRNLPVYFSS